MPSVGIMRPNVIVVPRHSRAKGRAVTALAMSPVIKASSKRQQLVLVTRKVMRTPRSAEIMEQDVPEKVGCEAEPDVHSILASIDHDK